MKSFLTLKRMNSMRPRGFLAPGLALFVVTFSLVSCPPPVLSPGIFHLYLTWQGDTSTTMTVNYHAPVDHGVSAVRFDTSSRGGVARRYASIATGAAHTLPGLDIFPGADRSIHVVELEGLLPGTTYYFIAGNDEMGYTEESSFRTLPDSGPIRFVTGGDMGTSGAVEDLLEEAAELDPMVVLVGGDIAYANGAHENWELWEEWLDSWEEDMISPDGHLIPMILGIGNHEVLGGFDVVTPQELIAPFYFNYFAQGESAYFSRMLGPRIKLIVLDSLHTNLVTGLQRAWLEAELASTPSDVRTVALYHIPMYPSHRGFDGINSQLLRSAWLPLFDDYGLSVAFENHDHFQKRTHLLRGNQIDPEGTLYLGDGCFGRPARDGVQAHALANPMEVSRLGLAENYLAYWNDKRHFWFVEVSEDGSMEFMAIDRDGDVFDQTTLPAILSIP